MTSGINHQAIIIANGMGIILMLMILLCNGWRLREKSPENRLLSMLMILTIISCITDPISFCMDGHPGAFSHSLIFASNWWLFVMNLILGPMWIAFVCSHMRIRLTRNHVLALLGIDIVGLIPLVLTFFFPVVFGVGSDNVYYRGPAYGLYIVLEAVFMIDSILIYTRARKESGLLKLFPVWAFLIPLVIGIAVQSSSYGISTIWPGVAVAVSSIMISLQNELIFRDKLTGLYNRFYLDRLKKDIHKSAHGHYTAMMLDLNDFKSINDTYGHSVGDRALIETAGILLEAVGNLGSVIRYAGDEFVILINTQDDNRIRRCIARIHGGMETFNMISGKPYKLSTSLGWSKMDLAEHSVDELLNEIDHKMFDDKRQHYAAMTYDRRARR